MPKLELKRPLAFFDIEATGISPRGDRIVELAIIKLMPDGGRVSHTWRVNPEMPIPEEATRIHGITDDDVADEPTFAQIAREVFEILEDCDVGGYNVARFDVPMLTEEFQRADIKFGIEDRKIIDAQRIYHQREPRNLEAAVQFFCGRPHTGAHGAEADTQATIDVLEAQLERYSDLPRTVAELDEYCNPGDPAWVDRIGRLKWANGEVVLNFGRKKGTPLREIVEEDPGFIKWILRSDFPADVKKIVQNALEGNWPSPPDKAPGKEEKPRKAKQSEFKLD